MLMRAALAGVLTGIGLSVTGQSIPSILPKVGENLYHISYTSDEGFFGTDFSGKDMIWDYSYLQAPFQREINVDKVASGSNAMDSPEADYVLREANDQEIHLMRSGQNLFETGRSGGIWLLDLPVKFIRYGTKPLVRRSGMKYGDSYSDISDFTVSIPKGKLPGHQAKKLSASADSVMFKVSVISEISADGKGQLYLPQSYHEVLLTRRDVEVNLQVYIHERAGWMELKNDNRNRSGSDGLLQGLFHFEIFEFWAASSPLPVLTIERRQDGTFGIDYLVTNQDVPLIRVQDTKRDVVAYPNPTYGEIEFQMINLPPGEYELQIYNIVSKPLHREKFSVSLARKIRTDLSFLSKGTYLYSILDVNGNKVVTKRVMIITP